MLFQKKIPKKAEKLFTPNCDENSISEEPKVNIEFLSYSEDDDVPENVTFSYKVNISEKDIDTLKKAVKILDAYANEVFDTSFTTEDGTDIYDCDEDNNIYMTAGEINDSIIWRIREIIADSNRTITKEGYKEY